MSGPVRPPSALLADAPPDLLEGLDWLVPDHLDHPGGDYVATIGGWLLRGEGRTVLFDTGAGAGKDRPSFPRYDRREDTFAPALAALAVPPEAVDTVVLSHLHVDHVGGATRWADGAWRPAFPAARYVVGRAELEDARRKAAEGRDDADLIFGDSVAPLLLAGVLAAVDLPFVVAPDLTLEAAPGHTIGHALMRLVSDGAEALLTADLAHAVLQFLRPDLNTVFCEHPDLARRKPRGYFFGRGNRSVYSTTDTSVLVKVVTRDAAFGWGECYAIVAPDAVAEIRTDLLGPLCVGLDPRDAVPLHEDPSTTRCGCAASLAATASAPSRASTLRCATSPLGSPICRSRGSSAGGGTPRSPPTSPTAEVHSA